MLKKLAVFLWVFFLSASLFAEPTVDIVYLTSEGETIETEGVIARFKGFPVGQEITLFTKSVFQASSSDPVETLRFEIDEEGKVQVDGDTLNYLTLPTDEYLIGERVYCRFVLADGTLINETSYIARPFTNNNVEIQKVKGERMKNATPNNKFQSRMNRLANQRQKVKRMRAAASAKEAKKNKKK